MIKKNWLVIALGLLVAVVFAGDYLLVRNETRLGAAVTAVETTDTIGTFRTRFNQAISDSTSTLGALTRLSTTTGNLIVASSSANGGWIALAVGSNGKLLVASSTAPNGVSWETSATGITSLGGLTGATQIFTVTTTASGLNLTSAGTSHQFWIATSTDSQAGFLSSADWTTFNNKLGATWGANINAAGYNLTGIGTLTATSVTAGTLTVSSLANSPFIVGGSATSTITGDGTLTTIGGSLQVASSAYLGVTSGNVGIGMSNPTYKFQVNGTSTVSAGNFYIASSSHGLFFSDGTKIKTAYRDIGFNISNATTTVTATTTIQKMFYQAVTISQIDCSSNGANATITADIRASSTPDTIGTSIGGDMVCDSNGFSTTTFASASLSAFQILNFNITSLSNSTTSIRTHIRYSDD